jgi:hypothetical protein
MSCSEGNIGVKKEDTLLLQSMSYQDVSTIALSFPTGGSGVFTRTLGLDKIETPAD